MPSGLLATCACAQSGHHALETRAAAEAQLGEIEGLLDEGVGRQHIEDLSKSGAVSQIETTAPTEASPATQLMEPLYASADVSAIDAVDIDEPCPADKREAPNR